MTDWREAREHLARFMADRIGLRVDDGCYVWAEAALDWIEEGHCMPYLRMWFGARRSSDA